MENELQINISLSDNDWLQIRNLKSEKSAYYDYENKCLVTTETNYIFKVKAIEDLTSQDWKVYLLKDMKPIPAGEILEVEATSNYDGNYFKTKYNDKIYYVDYSKTCDLEIHKKKIKRIVTDNQIIETVLEQS